MRTLNEFELVFVAGGSGVDTSDDDDDKGSGDSGSNDTTGCRNAATSQKEAQDGGMNYSIVETQKTKLSAGLGFIHFEQTKTKTTTVTQKDDDD